MTVTIFMPQEGGGAYFREDPGGSGGDPLHWAKTTLRANMLCFTMVFAKVRRRAPGKGGRGEGKPSGVLTHSTKGRRILRRALCFEPPEHIFSKRRNQQVQP